MVACRNDTQFRDNVRILAGNVGDQRMNTFIEFLPFALMTLLVAMPIVMFLITLRVIWNYAKG